MSGSEDGDALAKLMAGMGFTDDEDEEGNKDAKEDLDDEEEEEEELDLEALAEEKRLLEAQALEEALRVQQQEKRANRFGCPRPGDPEYETFSMEKDIVLRILQQPHLEYQTRQQRLQEQVNEARMKWEQAEQDKVAKGNEDAVRAAQRKMRLQMMENAKELLAKRAQERTKAGQRFSQDALVEAMLAKKRRRKKEDEDRLAEQRAWNRKITDAFIDTFTLRPVWKAIGNEAANVTAKQAAQASDVYERLPTYLRLQQELGVMEEKERLVLERDMALENMFMEKVKYNEDKSERWYMKAVPFLQAEHSSDNTYEPQNRLMDTHALHPTREPPKLGPPVWPAQGLRIVQTPDVVRDTHTRKWFDAYEEKNRYFTKIEHSKLPTTIPNTSKTQFPGAPVTVASFMLHPPEDEQRGFPKRNLWVKKESRRHPGFHYWQNQATGDTVWDDASFPLKQEKYFEAVEGEGQLQGTWKSEDDIKEAHGGIPVDKHLLPGGQLLSDGLLSGHLPPGYVPQIDRKLYPVGLEKSPSPIKRGWAQGLLSKTGAGGGSVLTQTAKKVTQNVSSEAGASGTKASVEGSPGGTGGGNKAPPGTTTSAPGAGGGTSKFPSRPLDAKQDSLMRSAGVSSDSQGLDYRRSRRPSEPTLRRTGVFEAIKKEYADNIVEGPRRSQDKHFQPGTSTMSSSTRKGKGNKEKEPIKQQEGEAQLNMAPPCDFRPDNDRMSSMDPSMEFTANLSSTTSVEDMEKKVHAYYADWRNELLEETPPDSKTLLFRQHRLLSEVSQPPIVGRRTWRRDPSLYLSASNKKAQGPTRQ
ncbi:unnamed protein product [Amoebophrya sp. A25]|nr:unnamed protein product [Amoebophrya sp. A25]|eukprot:GSA25T00008471001.1